MGSITRTVEPDTYLTVFTVTDETDAVQVLTAIMAFLLEAPTQRVLWDIRSGSLTALSSHDLHLIVQRAGPFTLVRSGGRTAIVCSREVDFGLCRMFQAFVEEDRLPFEIRVTRDVVEARRWLETGF